MFVSLFDCGAASRSTFYTVLNAALGVPITLEGNWEGKRRVANWMVVIPGWYMFVSFFGCV
jgi:E3 ubiquitin-protein ligase DOA10